MDVLLEGSPISTEELWSSVRVTIGFLVISLLPRLLILARRPALGRILAVPNVFHLIMMEATVFLGPFNAAECFVTLPQICASTQSCLGALRTLPSTSWFGFLTRSTVGPYTNSCVPFQIMTNQLNSPQVDSNQGLETFQG